MFPISWWCHCLCTFPQYNLGYDAKENWQGAVSCVSSAKLTVYIGSVTALTSLGFSPEMLETVKSVMEDCREQAARRLKRHNSRLDKLGIPEEELLKQQQELFHKVFICRFFYFRLHQAIVYLLQIIPVTLHFCHFSSYYLRVFQLLHFLDFVSVMISCGPYHLCSEIHAVLCFVPGSSRSV